MELSKTEKWPGFFFSAPPIEKATVFRRRGCE